MHKINDNANSATLLRGENVSFCIFMHLTLKCVVCVDDIVFLESQSFCYS